MKTRVISLPKKLTRKEALSKARKKVKDFRGFKYNPRTGKAYVT